MVGLASACHDLCLNMAFLGKMRRLEWVLEWAGSATTYHCM